MITKTSVHRLGNAKGVPNPLIAFSDTPEKEGLFIDNTHLGYYNHPNWITYMDNTGNFYLGGANGPLQWTSIDSTLSIGNWGFDTDKIWRDGDTDAESAGMSPIDYPFYAGKKFADRATAPFRVSLDGSVVAKDIITNTRQLSAVPGDNLQDLIDEVAVTGGTLGLRNGYYPLDNDLNIPSGVYLRGETIEGAILDFLDNTHGIKSIGTNVYKDGFVDATPGDIVVTGIGTTWTDVDMANAPWIFLQESWAEIASIESDTSLTLVSPYSWSPLSNSAYVIATPVTDTQVLYLTILNADVGVLAQYQRNFGFDSLMIASSGVGMSVTDSANGTFNNVGTYYCGYGQVYTNCHLMENKTPGVVGCLDFGLRLDRCANISIVNAFIGGNGTNGLELDTCNSVTVGGTFLANTLDGASILDSYSCALTGSSFSGNANGVEISNSSEVGVNLGGINGNAGYGVTIDATSTDNMIVGCSFTFNGSGGLNDLGVNTEIGVNTGIDNYAKLEAHPVGSVYMSVLNTDPTTELGGSWEAIAPGYTIDSIPIYVWKRV